MPMKPLTTEEIAKLRKLYEGIGEVTVSGEDGKVTVTATEDLSDAMLQAFATAPRLIAEVEELRSLMRVALDHADSATPHGPDAPCEGKPPCWCARAQELVGG